eukprot:11543852-Alexandrium_andersonii.AAC.1
MSTTCSSASTRTARRSRKEITQLVFDESKICSYCGKHAAQHDDYGITVDMRQSSLGPPTLEVTRQRYVEGHGCPLDGPTALRAPLGLRFARLDCSVGAGGH